MEPGLKDSLLRKCVQCLLPTEVLGVSLWGKEDREIQSKGLLVPENFTLPGQFQFLPSTVSDPGIEFLGQGRVGRGIHPSLCICGRGTFK